jgi:hypothetical protein
VVLRAPAGAYAAAYGTAAVGAFDVVVPYLRTVFPFAPIAPVLAPAIVLADAAWIGLLLTGSYLAARGARSTSAAPLVAIGLGLPALGAIAYLPWPDYHLFYAFPFLIGPAILVALSLSAIERHRPRLAGAWYGVWAFAAFYAGTAAHALARRTDAVQHLMASTVQVLGTLEKPDSMYVAVRRVAPPGQGWQGLGPTLSRYGHALGIALPPVRDVPCDAAAARAGGRLERSVVVFYSAHCLAPPLPVAPRRIVVSFERFDWVPLAVIADSLQVEIAAATPTEPPPAARRRLIRARFVSR